MSSNEPPLEDPIRPDLRVAKSLVVLFTGEGKGKTSAGIGTAVRAAGHGWKVSILQFLKSGDWSTGEGKACHQLGIDFESIGAGFTWDSDNIENDIRIANDAWSIAAEQISSGLYQLVVLDELTYLVAWGWVDEEKVVQTISARPENVSVVITGRDATPGLIQIADTASDIVSLHHAYEQGIAAKKGIDF